MVRASGFLPGISRRGGDVDGLDIEEVMAWTSCASGAGAADRRSIRMPRWYLARLRE
jgi:hypothetical protein